MNSSSPARPTLSSSEWRLVLLLAAINFTHILDFVIVMPLGDQLREELLISPQQFGFVVSAYGIAAMIAGVLASTIVDHFDRKRTMLLSFAGFIASTLYCGLSPTYSHLVLARALAGCCGGVVASTVMAFIVDLIPEQRRGRAIGVVTSSFAFASTIGLPFGLYLANRVGQFGSPFIAITVLGIFVWVISAWRLPRLRPRISASHANAWSRLLYVATRPNHLRSFAFMLALVLSTFAIVPYIAAYLEANCGIARAYLPVIYGVAGVFTLVSLNVIGWLTDRFGARPVFTCCIVGAASMSLVITNLPPTTLGIAVVVTTLFMTVASGRVVPAQAMMLRSADPEHRGAFTSLNSAVSHLATGTGPILSGAIIGEEYPQGPLTHYWIAGAIAAGFGMLALILSYFLRPAPSVVVDANCERPTTNAECGTRSQGNSDQPTPCSLAAVPADHDADNPAA